MCFNDLNNMFKFGYVNFFVTFFIKLYISRHSVAKFLGHCAIYKTSQHILMFFDKVKNILQPAPLPPNQCCLTFFLISKPASILIHCMGEGGFAVEGRTNIVSYNKRQCPKNFATECNSIY